MSRTKQIAEEVAVIMPEIARRILLGFFQSVDITQTQIFTIMTISEQSPIRLSALSRKLHIAAPTVTGIIDRLERSGYVKRTPDPQDRRAVHVDLTPRGRRVAKKLKTTIQKKWQALLARLPEADQEHYVRILRKVRRDIR